MTLVVVNVGGSRDHPASLFKSNSATFQEMIEEFLHVIHLWSYRHIVKHQERGFSMSKLIREEAQFKYFSEA